MKISRGELIDAILLAEKREKTNYTELLDLYYTELEKLDEKIRDAYTVNLNVNKISTSAKTLIFECVDAIE